jgi:hypothetical protein
MVLGLSSLAGCVGGQRSRGPSGTATPSKDTDRVFQRVAVEGTTLVIDLAEDADIDTVNVISPSGELYRRLAVYRGVTALSTDIDESYVPGTYEVIGVKDSNSVSTVALEIAPKLRIADILLPSEARDEFPEGLGNTLESQMGVAVENEGSGPAFIHKLLILGNVPNPTTELLDDRAQETGVYDSEVGRFRSESVTLLAGDSTILFSNTLPLFTRGGWYCEQVTSGGDAEIRIVIGQSATAVTTRQQISYSESEEGRDCVARTEMGA